MATATNQTSAASQTIRAATKSQIAAAQQTLSRTVSTQGLTQLDADNVNWNSAQTFEAGDATLLTVRTESGEAVVIGLEEDDNPIVGIGTRTVNADGNIVLTSENLISHTKSITILAPDGLTLISEERFGESGNRLTEQYTCAELRDRVDDARTSANDAKVEMGVAVATCAAGCIELGPAGAVIAGVGLIWYSNKVIRTDSSYRKVAKTYHENCA